MHHQFRGIPKWLWCLLMSTDGYCIWAHSPCLSFWESTSRGKSQASPIRNRCLDVTRCDKMWQDVTLAHVLAHIVASWHASGPAHVLPVFDTGTSRTGGQGTRRWSDQGEAQSGEIQLHLGGSNGSRDRRAPKWSLNGFKMVLKWIYRLSIECRSLSQFVDYT